jgi:hypothetical protein
MLRKALGKVHAQKGRMVGKRESEARRAAVSWEDA